MSRSQVFILIAATAAGFWSVLLSRASKLVTPIVGTGIVEGTAVVLVLILIFRQRVDLSSALTPIGAGLLLLCGLCVFSVDYFSLRAFELGMEVSVGAPTIAAGAILVPALLGTILGEEVSIPKVFGISLIGAGVFVLARFSA